MSENLKNTALFLIVSGLILATGFMQSWNSAILILNMGLVSAVMALGVNLQWGLAGLFNIGVMGFVALGGLAVVLVSTEAAARGLGGGRPGHPAGAAAGRGRRDRRDHGQPQTAPGPAAQSGGSGHPDRGFPALPLGLRRKRGGGRGDQSGRGGPYRRPRPARAAGLAHGRPCWRRARPG